MLCMMHNKLIPRKTSMILNQKVKFKKKKNSKILLTYYFATQKSTTTRALKELPSIVSATHLGELIAFFKELDSRVVSGMDNCCAK